MNIKMLAKMLAVPLVLLAVGCRDRYEGQAGAASSPSPDSSPYSSGSMASPAMGTGTGMGNISAVVVAVDATGRTITLREGTAGAAPTGDQQGRRYNVSSSAASSLSTVHAGDEVYVMCDETGGGAGSSGMGGTGASGSTGTGTTGTGTTGSGSAGYGATGSGSMGSGSLANCTTITMISPGGGTTGR
jgi:hypothetical protein